MSNRKLVAVAAALIVGVVASVAWFLVGEAAAQRAQLEERRPPVVERPSPDRLSSMGGAASVLRVAHRAPTASVPCPCLETQRQG